MLRSALVAICLAAVPCCAFAQAADPAIIAGFSSMPWGSSEAAIRERFGEPVQVYPLAPLKVLIYSDQVLGKQVTTWFYMHPEHNLVAGGYLAPYGVGNDCWNTYTRFRDAVSERYPALQPNLVEQNGAQGLDMCSAIAINRAVASTRWDDANGGRILTQLTNEPDNVNTWYFSPPGVQLVEAANAAQRQSRF